MLSWTYEAKSATHLDLTKPAKSKSDTMREYNRVYREKHSAYITCDCGSTFKEISKYTHQHTARHMQYMEERKE